MKCYFTVLTIKEKEYFILEIRRLNNNLQKLRGPAQPPKF
jgi:hypothetical protein